MRTKNVFKNFMTAWFGQLIVVLCTFVSRWVFIKILPIEYLGINGLFTNILTLLSFADLGLGLSISYYLYEPLANNDEMKIIQTVQYYKKIYTMIGCIVLIVGLLLTPFLQYIIKDCTISYIKLIYCMHIFNASVSYFNIHKTTLLTADQKNYINVLYTNGIKVLQVIVSCIVLIITNSYIAYYSVQIIATLLTNYLISRKVDRLYPYIKQVGKVQKNESLQQLIKSNMGAMILHKFSSVIVTGTDNILISIFVNLATTGLYSNYSVIISNITRFVSQIFGSMAAGIGNFSASEDYDKKTKLFYTMMLLQFWIYGLCSIGLVVLISPFVKLWLGENFQLNQGVVLVLVLNFYLQGMRKIVLMFRDAEGLFKQDCYKALIEAFVNLFSSIYLAKRYGLVGVFIGTIISTVTTCVWLEPFVLFRNGLQGGLFKYYMRYIRYFMEAMIAGVITYVLSSLLQDTIGMFVVKGLLCCVIPNLLFLVLHYKDEEFHDLWVKVKVVLLKNRIEGK